VKGVNFVDIRDAGDPVELAKAYVQQGADELVFLDITATVEKRKTFVELVGRIAAEINIPFTVGGGISTVDDVRILLSAGADKISVNSSAVKRPELISELAQQFGNQCIVVAIDTGRIDGAWRVFTHGGRTRPHSTPSHGQPRRSAEGQASCWSHPWSMTALRRVSPSICLALWENRSVFPSSLQEVPETRATL